MEEKIYLVVAGAYSDRHEVAVFKTREEAEDFVEVYNRGNTYTYGQAGVNEMVFGVRYDYKNEVMFDIYFNSKSEIVDFDSLDLAYNDYLINSLPRVHKYDRCWGNDVLYRVTVTAIDPNHAKKIATDILSMWKAEKEEIV